MAGIVAARLFDHTAEQQWRERLEGLLIAFAGGAVQLSIHGATLLRAIDWYQNPSAHVVIVGDLRDPAVAALHRTARTLYRPRKVITVLSPDAPRTPLPAPLQAMVNGHAPRASVCDRPQCGPPAISTKELAETLQSIGRGGG